MNDLDLCKRIAEIEGCKDFEIIPSGVHGDQVLANFGICDPITDDALCFQLMVKYDIDLLSPYRKNGEIKWEAQIFSKDYADAFQIYDESPSKAICLCIIEAHKDN